MPEESQGPTNVSTLACSGLAWAGRLEATGSPLTGKGKCRSAHQWPGHASGLQARGLAFTLFPKGSRAASVCEQTSKAPRAEGKNTQRKNLYKNHVSGG